MGIKENLRLDWDSELESSQFCVERDGFLIWGTEYRRKFPRHKQQTPVIISHGFMSNQRETSEYAKYFAMWGCAAYTFDFVGGNRDGKSDGSLATDMTVWTEVEDLKRVISYVTNLEYVRPEKLILAGCSQGGVVSALVAADLKEKVDQLILLYPALCIPDDARAGQCMIFKFDPHNVPDQIPADESNPFTRIIYTAKPGTKAPVLNGDYVRSMQDVDIFEKIAPYHGRVLIIHGTEDKVVNYSYARRAYKQYQENRQGLLKIAYLKNHAIEGAAVENVPDPDCHLVLIDGAPHGFHGETRKAALQEIKHFLKRQAEVLTVDIHLTGHDIDVDGVYTTVTLPFTGRCDTEYFRGEVLPGASDVQKRKGTTAIEFNANYVLSGKDYTGQECRISINNHYDGKIWKPTLRTDSQALDFLNHADAEAYLEQHKGGPVVRIYVSQKEI